MINALMLFGSAARGDNDENSDTDLIAIADVNQPFSKKIHDAEMQFLTRAALMKSASRGELFAIHLAFEGRVIFDNDGVFREFKERLVIRDDYSQERLWSYDLAWYLHEFGMQRDAALVNKRIAWCVRTILISMEVEKGRIIFAPAALAREYPNDFAPDLVGLRRSKSSSSDRQRKLRKFLSSVEANRPRFGAEEKYRLHFEATKNEVASQTYDRLNKPKSKERILY